MSDQEILEKAVSRAIDAGWEYDELTTGSAKDKGRYVLKLSKPSQIRGLIFNHDFAKALWGESEDYQLPGMDENVWIAGLPKYKWHLQQMVIADDPIKYLGKNI